MGRQDRQGQGWYVGGPYDPNAGSSTPARRRTTSHRPRHHSQVSTTIPLKIFDPFGTKRGKSRKSTMGIAEEEGDQTRNRHHVHSGPAKFASTVAAQARGNPGT